MDAYLKKHGPAVAAHTVKVAWEVQERSVRITFTAQKRSGRPWLSDPVFSDDWSKNWGLWNKDVVEAFLQLRTHPGDHGAPYLEVQLSPLNQPFALVITEPRKIFAAPKALDLSHSVSLDGRRWDAAVTVLLPPEVTGRDLYGGFFACLDTDPREYYALEPNPEENPDFHRPELFTLLGMA